MWNRECDSVSDAIREVFDLVRADRRRFESGKRDDEAMYYFRGENKNFKRPENFSLPDYPAIPGIDREEEYHQNEHLIFNECIRAYPQEFPSGETTFERLTRMQHFEIPTRLLDVSPRLATALGMASLPGIDGKEVVGRYGFIRIYRVKKSRIKYSTSDTVVALSNLARIRKEHVHINDLRYLAAECTNERTGFYWKEGSEVSIALQRDIKKVWCVRPVNNNVRIQAQRGEFFLFGCGEGKQPLEVSFSEYDYDNPNAATEGIAEIGILVVTPQLKHEIKEMAEVLDVTEDRLYPDFARFHKVIEERYGKTWCAKRSSAELAN